MVRNSSSEVPVALSQIIPLPSSVVAAETIAARRAVSFIQELYLHSSIFEGDSKASILAIKRQCFHHPFLGNLIKDIMSLVSSLHYFSFSHTRRQGNALAYAFAQRARYSFLVLIWRTPDIYKLYVFDVLAIKQLNQQAGRFLQKKKNV